MTISSGEKQAIELSAAFKKGELTVEEYAAKVYEAILIWGKDSKEARKRKPKAKTEEAPAQATGGGKEDAYFERQRKLDAERKERLGRVA